MSSASPSLAARKSNPLSRKRVIVRNDDTPVAPLSSSTIATTAAADEVGEPNTMAIDNTDMPPPPPTPQHKTSKPAFDIVEATSAATSRPQTPLSSSSAAAAAASSPSQQQPPSAAERGLLRGAIDEKKLYSGYRSQTEKWLALSHIGQNFLTVSMRADTAVDFAREQTQQ